jgi:hypothetical protein
MCYVLPLLRHRKARKSVCTVVSRDEAQCVWSLALRKYYLVLKSNTSEYYERDQEVRSVQLQAPALPVDGGSVQASTTASSTPSLLA